MRSVFRSAALLAVLVLPATAQETPALPPGRLLETVVTLADPAQSYALYLPSQYNAQRPWPVLFVFDSAARGALAAEVFRPAAERFGYIVLASNNSRNGPRRLATEAFLAMLADAQKRFSTDRTRLYTAGLSGGARAAGLAGFSCDQCIRAVISCGAGLPEGLDQKHRAQLPAYFFLVGKYDFNYFEVVDTARALPRAPGIAVFDGSHQWPPPEVAAQALAWLEAGMPGAKRDPTAERAEGPQRRHQAELTRYLSQLMGAIQQNYEERQQNVADARGAMADLRKRREQAADDSEVTVLRRALGQMFATAWETGERMLREQEPALAASFFEIAAEAAPSNPGVAYQVAAAYGAAGDKDRAFAALRRAVAAGFHDAAQLEGDPAFSRWRNSAEFQALLRSAGSP